MKPNTPEAENIMYNNKPTTTGGMLIKVFVMTITVSLPKNLDEAMWAAIIIEKNADNIVANNDIYKDKSTILR